MNKFKRDMDKFIGESPHFNEASKEKILLRINEENRPRKLIRRGFNTLKITAIFTVLLAVVGSFLVAALLGMGEERQASTSIRKTVPVKNFSDESEDWKVTYSQTEVEDGVRSAFLTLEYIGEGSKPEDASYQFFYKKDQESFGGSVTLNEDSSYANVNFGTCTTCILYTDQDEIPGTIEWAGQQENLVLKKTDESKWQESPLFESGPYTMIGEEGRAGFIYDDAEVSRINEDKTQKYMWHFWGSQAELTGTFKVLGVHENSPEEIVVVPKMKSRPSPNNGADHHIPTMMELPEKGMWKLTAVFNDKVIGTVYVEVHEK
ncbi:hypothetical protein QWY22_09235 [Planococcus liqunii]|uniref:hypothetical protein n=1 Tax=Planococcus liqunii TaxID=3058394 RepID=UPI002633E0E7|nr:hypothetical protein [Planococcus sp. N056]WKA52719.1 hypothetical protein QWY22_09235 [Planococcus sp. N056]